LPGSTFFSSPSPSNPFGSFNPIGLLSILVYGLCHGWNIGLKNNAEQRLLSMNVYGSKVIQTKGLNKKKVPKTGNLKKIFVH
jgi:hypothetical protein